MLVFANITIVDNEVGLLNGKLDMTALEVKLELKSDPKLSKFWLLNTEIETQDNLSHCWFMLNQPRKFTEAEKGTSLQKRTDGRIVAMSVNAAKHHQLAKSFDPAIEIMRDINEIHLATEEPAECVVQELETDEKSECDMMTMTPDYDDLESNSSISIGIFEDILSGNADDLDTDSDCEFDEESRNFVKTMTSKTTDAKETSSVDTYVLDAFNVELAGVEMSKENTTELISRL